MWGVDEDKRSSTSKVASRGIQCPASSTREFDLCTYFFFPSISTYYKDCNLWSWGRSYTITRPHFSKNLWENEDVCDVNKVRTIRHITATVIWTHMIDFEFSAVVWPICRWTSAEVKSYTQDCCCEKKKKWKMVHMVVWQARKTTRSSKRQKKKIFKSESWKCWGRSLENSGRTQNGE